MSARCRPSLYLSTFTRIGGVRRGWGCAILMTARGTMLFGEWPTTPGCSYRFDRGGVCAERPPSSACRFPWSPVGEKCVQTWPSNETLDDAFGSG